MTPNEVRTILTILATAHDRAIPDGLADVWSATLADVAFDDGRAAAIELLKSSPYLPKIAEIRDGARLIAAERERTEQRQRQLEARAQPIAGVRSDAATALVRSVVANLPGIPSDRIHERAAIRARRERGRVERPPPSKAAKSKTGDWPEPQSDDIAALATRYLIDGYEPNAVAERLAVSRRWCRSVAAKFNHAEPA